MAAGSNRKSLVETKRADTRCWWHSCYVCVICDTVRGWIPTIKRFTGEWFHALNSVLVGSLTTISRIIFLIHFFLDCVSHGLQRHFLTFSPSSLWSSTLRTIWSIAKVFRSLHCVVHCGLESFNAPANLRVLLASAVESNDGFTLHHFSVIWSYIFAIKQHSLNNKGCHTP